MPVSEMDGPVVEKPEPSRSTVTCPEAAVEILATASPTRVPRTQASPISTLFRNTQAHGLEPSELGVRQPLAAGHHGAPDLTRGAGWASTAARLLLGAP
jgi:hypothetical protein